MTWFDIKSLHCTSFARRFAYLHYGTSPEYDDNGVIKRRDIGLDVYGELSDVVDPSLPAALAWSQQMEDQIRLYNETHPAKGNGKQRTGYSFIISLSPDDDATLDDLRTLVSEFLTRNFPNCTASVVYHDDNTIRTKAGEVGILHAHGTISAIVEDGDGSIESLHKIRLSKAKITRMYRSVQEISKEMGLSYFDNHGKVERPEAFYDRDSISAPERHILTEDRYSWKDELREIVKRTVPFCTSLESLNRTLAPYGFSATLVDMDSGVLMFRNPEGRKVNSKKLGCGFKATDLKRFYRDVSFIELNGRSFDSYHDSIKVKRSVLQQQKRVMQAELQVKIDALSVIWNEGIDSYDDFDALKRELLAKARSAEKDLDYLIGDLKGRDGAEGENVAYDYACDFIDHVDAFDQYRSLAPNSVAREEYYSSHRAEIDAFVAADDFFYQKGIPTNEEELNRIIAGYRASAKRQLELQAAIEGYSRRIEDVNRAQYVARVIEEECLAKENEERIEKGMGPRMVRDPEFRKPPKSYRTKYAPVFRANIDKVKYQLIREANIESRRRLARTEPDRKLPPYMGKDLQIKNSVIDQERRHVTVPQARKQQLIERGSGEWSGIVSRSAEREQQKNQAKGSETK